MRVALLTNFIPPYRVPLLEALRDRVAELRIFISTPMEKDRDWAIEWGSLDVVVQRNLSFHRRHRDLDKPISRLRHGEETIHLPYDTLPQLWRYGPDVVLSGQLGAHSLQAAMYRLGRPSTKLLIWGTVSDWTERNRGPVRRGLRRALLRVADGVLTNGESGARYFGRFGVPDRRIFRVSQTVPVDMFARAPRNRPPDAPLRLLHVGKIVALKGVLGFMKVLADRARQHPDRVLEMWWAGRGDLQRTLEALDLPPNLTQRFLGSLPYSDLPPVYAQCDILVFPTLADEWGLVVNEAMAAGLPVLGSVYSQAVEELVTDGETGWIFDPLSAASEDAALERALRTAPDSIAAMGATSRVRVAALTPAAVADRIVRAMTAVRADGERAP
ncbi:glycosyltransferase family 4 protein [Craurococcus roseus]|uniref:Glycosyltransferase family 4 protein n=1 Tax=Craurococcus roseus TaxID=77585 RepID=A0ABP3QWU3_9PROT